MFQHMLSFQKGTNSPVIIILLHAVLTRQGDMKVSASHVAPTSQLHQLHRLMNTGLNNMSNQLKFVVNNVTNSTAHTRGHVGVSATCAKCQRLPIVITLLSLPSRMVHLILL